MAQYYSTVWIDHIFIHLSDRHLGGFHLLMTVYNAAVNVCLQVSVWTHVFISLGHILLEWNCWVTRQFYVSLFEELPDFSEAAAPIIST